MNKAVIAGSVACLLAGFGAGQVNAQTTFATFDNNFRLKYLNGVLENFSNVPAGKGEEVTFKFTSGPYAGQAVNAHLKLSVSAASNTSATRVKVKNSHNVTTFDMDTVLMKNLTASFVADNPFHGATNLLTVSDATATLTGDNLSPFNWKLDAIDPTFTSAYFASLMAPSDFNLEFTSNDIPIPVTGTSSTVVTGSGATKTTTTTTVGTLNSFSSQSDASGSASATLPTSGGGGGVPEPGQVSMFLGLAVSGAGFVLGRRRRKA